MSNKGTLELAEKLNLPFEGNKCPAHLYHLERQGDSPKSRFIYRCKRPGCRHYATLSDIEGRIAQCRNCGRVFVIVIADHIIKNRDNPSTPEEMLYEFPVCCVEVKSVTIDEVDNLAHKLE